MNERIRELERQATDYYSNGQERIFDRQKFAELIIRECAQDFDNTYMRGGKTMGAYIREKFGVES
jgi:hypothetical protein